MEKALLVSVQIKSEPGHWRIDDTAAEFEELVRSCGAEILDNIVSVCEKPTANFLIGSGKTEEIGLIAQELGAQVVIFSHDLSGTQQRNLEDKIGIKTIDRTQLILDIFSMRAKSPEGKLQVELAQLEYLMPRLIGKGVILSRMGGGIGSRGPGETELEVDRRRIRKKIDKLKADLSDFERHRRSQKKRRKDNDIVVVALIGYTSAGKSTLINKLTSSNQIVSEKLFTTLDPLSKSLKLSDGQTVIISDTVGFLHQLPHNLIEAFKATLEEVVDADLLVHVLDANSAMCKQHNKAVLEVLEQLGIKDKPMIIALNKADLLTDNVLAENLRRDFEDALLISAKTGEGLKLLLDRIHGLFAKRVVKVELLLQHRRMDLLDLFYRQAKVYKVDYKENGIQVAISLPVHLYEQVIKENGVSNISTLGG